MRLGVSPAASTPTGVFNQRFEALFPRTETLGCVVCLAPQLFLPVYLHANVDCPLLWRVLPAWLPVSTPPTSLDEYFFFNCLVVRLPYSSILCKFWSFFVFKFVVVLLLVMQEGTVCLPTPPSWPEATVSILKTCSLLRVEQESTVEWVSG